MAGKPNALSWLVVFVLVCAASASASIFGNVRGVVHDPQHRPIKGAVVTIKSVSSDWQQTIATWIVGREPVTIERILEECLLKPRGQWLQADKNRVGRCLRVAGWEMFQKREPEGRQWAWKPKVGQDGLSHGSRASDNDV